MSPADHLEHLRRQIAHVPSVSNPKSRAKTIQPRRFRSQAADDLACILDFNRAVTCWSFGSAPLQVGSVRHVADFEMTDEGGTRWLLDAPDRRLPGPGGEIAEAALHQGVRYRLVSDGEIYDGFRLQNARDLLRYRGHPVSLGDRMRLLGSLDENGSLSFADCLRTFRDTQPVPALASLILQRLVDVDLDDALLGPETMVRRI